MPEDNGPFRLDAVFQTCLLNGMDELSYLLSLQRPKSPLLGSRRAFELGLTFLYSKTYGF